MLRVAWFETVTNDFWTNAKKKAVEVNMYDADADGWGVQVDTQNEKMLNAKLLNAKLSNAKL